MFGLMEEKKKALVNKAPVILTIEPTEMEKFEEKHCKGRVSHEVIFALFTLKQLQDDYSFYKNNCIEYVKAGKFFDGKVELQYLRQIYTKKTALEEELMECKLLLNGGDK